LLLSGITQFRLVNSENFFQQPTLH
jgi:hypothetical protein